MGPGVTLECQTRVSLHMFTGSMFSRLIVEGANHYSPKQHSGRFQGVACTKGCSQKVEELCEVWILSTNTDL